MPCRSWPVSYHNNSPHIQPYPHSQELFQMSLSCLLSSHSPLPPKSHVPLRMFFAWVLFWICFCLHGFVLEFCFSVFLFFWRDLWVILVLCILVCCSLFGEFLDSLHFREFLVLVGFLHFSIFEKVSFNLRPNPPHQDTSLRPHTNKRTRISPHDTTLHHYTQPHPTYSFPHSTLAPSTTIAPSTQRKLLFNCVPQIFLSESYPHRPNRYVGTSECESPTLALYQ